MIKYKHILTIALVIGISTFTFAQKMGPLTFIKAGGKVINVTMDYVGPAIYDLDKDGLQDLIIGNKNGEFMFYKNTGTNKKAVYNNFTYIKANGKRVKIPNW
jgi:hypothetical protein